MQNGMISLTAEAVSFRSCSWTPIEAAGWSTGPPAFPVFSAARRPHSLPDNSTWLGLAGQFQRPYPRGSHTNFVQDQALGGQR